MHQIESILYKQHDLTIYVATGAIQASEVIRAIKEFYSGTPTRLALWDFSHATFEHIKSSEVALISNISRQYSHERKGGKTAMLFLTDEGFGLGRMYDTHKEQNDLSHPYMSFRNKKEALNWLGVQL
jgi:hypothetical protein